MFFPVLEWNVSITSKRIFIIRGLRSILFLGVVKMVGMHPIRPRQT